MCSPMWTYKSSSVEQHTLMFSVCSCYTLFCLYEMKRGMWDLREVQNLLLDHWTWKQKTNIAGKVFVHDIESNWADLYTFSLTVGDARYFAFHNRCWMLLSFAVIFLSMHTAHTSCSTLRGLLLPVIELTVHYVNQGVNEIHCCE